VLQVQLLGEGLHITEPLDHQRSHALHVGTVKPLTRMEWRESGELARY
jgi:hypothetical protein